MDNFHPIPACDCDISCLAIDKIRSYKDSDQVIRFLKGLNDQYSSVRSQIMLMDPLPNISKVYSLLVQQERQIISPIDESKLLDFPIRAEVLLLVENMVHVVNPSMVEAEVLEYVHIVV